MNGVSFGSYHSYDDFNIVLTSREIPLPKPKTYKVDIPGADGELDLTTSLTDGIVKYENRPLKLKFSFLPPYSTIETRKSNIAALIQGQKLNITFDADDDFYYYGRCEITDFDTDKVPTEMTVEVDADPYKYSQEETVLTRSGAGSITVPAQRMPVVPTIYVSSACTLTHKTVQYALTSGNNVIPAVLLSSGDNNVLTFTGSGTKRVTFRGGEL